MITEKLALPEVSQQLISFRNMNITILPFVSLATRTDQLGTGIKKAGRPTINDFANGPPERIIADLDPDQALA